MPGRAAKQKGSTYERELAAYFNEMLFGGQAMVSRAPLSGGGRFSLQAGGTDLLGLPGLFVEAKRVERLDFRGAIQQAHTNARLRQTVDLPIVIARRNRESVGESVVVIRLSNFMEIYKAWLREKGMRIELVAAGPLFEVCDVSSEPAESLSLSPKTTAQL